MKPNEITPKDCQVELILRLKSGDVNAFRRIYNDHWATVYYQVFRVLKNEEDTKDVVQEVFSSLWIHREKLLDKTNLSAYLYVQARNRVLNLIASQKVRSDYLLSVAKYADRLHNMTEELIDSRELLRRVQQEIDQLPAKMREIFELSRKDDLSHREIAERLQISPETVKKQIKNALKLLKPRLKNIGGVCILLLMR
ncbi:RNA polymerase sigma-70 factor [Sphingobacterium sp. SGG-5]|uniref:RNA polymerase sigma-70 factor n=1 Tax=Sphingobacterium sp. SGG-5 TaxID=2710881 RepID=UPI0013EA3717|nr:RNA polymerase sigma-70 factor [Sphingobacterium sp. SGG-5]NGM62181.1 RNA polymerase sigma-70 factor [Sphingobacterium sp. SGG-5]